MYAIRIVGKAWYGIGARDDSSVNTLAFAKHYHTHDEALTAAMLLSTAVPSWMGKLRVHKIKKVRIQKVRIQKIKMEKDGKTTRLWPEQVDHYVTA